MHFNRFFQSIQYAPMWRDISNFGSQGLQQYLRRLVHACISLKSFAAILFIHNKNNGHLGSPSRGPTSPLLFIIVLEILSRMLLWEVDNGNVEMFNVGQTPLETHLTYIDDVILFCKPTAKSIATVQRILEDFSSFSHL